MKTSILRFLPFFIVLIFGFTGCTDPDLPDLPVTLSFRESSVGLGYVIRLTNASDRYMTVRARFFNPTLRAGRETTISLRPGLTTEFGWLEGWEFVSGESIEVAHHGFRTKAWTLP